MSTIESDDNHARRLPIGIVAAALLPYPAHKQRRPHQRATRFCRCRSRPVPSNGDLNPYGLAVVLQKSSGITLRTGQLLVSEKYRVTVREAAAPAARALPHHSAA